MTLFVAFLSAACIALSGPNITAGDMAKGVPGFVPTDPSTFVAYGPTPGVQRVMHPAETKLLLGRLQYESDTVPAELCFERPTHLLEPDAVAAAMRRTLGSDTNIEIVEISRFPAPDGELLFPRDGMGGPPVAVWNGYVRYDGVKKFPVWARVKLSTKITRVIALEQLKPGVPIKASQLATEEVEEFPQRRVSVESIALAEGALPKRYIAANTPVWLDSIDPANDITKGDHAIVSVHSGLAQLSFDAEAQASGRRGDVVAFKNPESGKVFRARVEGPRRAEVNP
jgi:flagella basal body P-ring formation protein FlgA